MELSGLFLGLKDYLSTAQSVHAYSFGFINPTGRRGLTVVFA